MSYPTVKDLISFLQHFPEESEVYGYDGEGGSQIVLNWDESDRKMEISFYTNGGDFDGQREEPRSVGKVDR